MRFGNSMGCRSLALAVSRAYLCSENADAHDASCVLVVWPWQGLG